LHDYNHDEMDSIMDKKEEALSMVIKAVKQRQRKVVL
jgi:hypothetical protein